MPWTPIAVSAWRTSSSLNGLIMATTSFMSGLHFRNSELQSRLGSAPVQLWHFFMQMAQKLAGAGGKALPFPVQARRTVAEHARFVLVEGWSHARTKAFTSVP